MSPWRLPLRDDAGVDRELMPMRAQPSGTIRLNRVRDKAHLVYSEITSFWKLTVRVIVLVIPMAIAMPFAILWLGSKGIPLPLFAGAGALVTMTAMLVLTKRDFRKLATRAPEIADAYLDEGVCPCCAYNLAGVVRGADETNSTAPLIRCTECGATWLRSRIHRVEADETAESREAPSFRTILRSQAMLYSSMAFQDDRGKSVALARFSDLTALRSRAGGTHRARLSACIDKLRFKGLWKRILFASLVLPLMIAIITDFATRPLSGIGVMQGLQALGLVVWIIGAFAIIGSDIGRSGARRAELLKAAGLCPGCGAELGVVDGTDTSAVTCGECRAVWDLSQGTEVSGNPITDAPPVEAR
ncbi:MAG: hypothetical protein KF805_06275 [Phycisphaeraceae bacterium]|nr:hypothetical protein [Phycisphaeraceae bacterium]